MNPCTNCKSSENVENFTIIRDEVPDLYQIQCTSCLSSSGSGLILDEVILDWNLKHPQGTMDNIPVPCPNCKTIPKVLRLEQPKRMAFYYVTCQKCYLTSACKNTDIEVISEWNETYGKSVPEPPKSTIDIVEQLETFFIITGYNNSRANINTIIVIQELGGPYEIDPKAFDKLFEALKKLKEQTND